MKSKRTDFTDEYPEYAAPAQADAEDDLWFLPGPPEDDTDDLRPGPRADAGEAVLLAEWLNAEAGLAAPLARVAGRFGALNDRLLRGPEGWRHRLALIEAAELSWSIGDRITADRLAQWLALRLSSAQEDTGVLLRAGWAARRLTGGPGPMTSFAAFLGRHDPEHPRDDSDLFIHRAESWIALMETGADLHPISRACMCYHLWSLVGLRPHSETPEAAVTAARIAAEEASGAIFVPLAMGGAGGLRGGGSPVERLARWLDGMDRAILTAMRHLDDIEAWAQRAELRMASLSGRTPALLRILLSEWPLISAPMAEELTGVSRASVQRNLNWMHVNGLIHEVTGQGRFRMWRAAL